MKSQELPFNVELLSLDSKRLNTLRPVTSVDFFESANGDLNEEGLFSIGIFGRIGDEVRDERFAYIDIKLDIFHPVIYERLVKLKALYQGIIAGSTFAVFDETLKDFVAADELTGQTGFSFFMSRWKEIVFQRNDSAIRTMRIELIEKYKDRATTDKILVMPAGLRDIEYDDDGRTTVGDINTLYRKLISISKTIPDTLNVKTDPAHDLARTMLQNTFNALYTLIEQILTGKSGFFQSKWASRRVFNGTRNVITAADLSTSFLGAPNSPKYTDTVVGLHQLSRAILPKTIYCLRNHYLPSIFGYGDNQARLVDPLTLHSEIVKIQPETYDRWMTTDGLEKVVASYGETAIRSKPVMVEDRYLALIYLGPDQTFKIFHDIEELPKHLNREHVRAINLVEFLYLSGYKDWNQYIGFVTRYPVTGVGSCFPATVYVKTTVVGEQRWELGEDWTPLGEDAIALEFPTYTPEAYLDSHVINSTRLARLGADFDGDMCSFTAIYSDEALEEQRRYLSSKNAFADPRGGLLASSQLPTIELVVLNMLGKV